MMRRAWMMAIAVGGVLAVGQLLAETPTTAPTTQKAEGEYEVARELQVDGEGTWDNWTAQPSTLDAEGKILYVPRGNRTQVIEVETGKVLKEIPGSEVRGVALAPEFGRGFISNYRTGSIAVFDLKTHAVLGRVHLGENPGAIIYDEASKRILVCNEGNRSIVPIPADIDLKTGKPEQSIALETIVKEMVTDGKGMVYATLNGKDEVVVIDTRTMTVATTWRVADWRRPLGLALDRERNRLYVGCRAKVAILSAVDGHEMGEVDVGTPNVSVGSGAVQFHDGKAYASCGEGVLAEIGQNGEGKFEVQRKIKIPKAGWGFQIDEKTGRIYLPASEPGPRGKPGGIKLAVLERRKAE